MQPFMEHNVAWWNKQQHNAVNKRFMTHMLILMLKTWSTVCVFLRPYWLHLRRWGWWAPCRRNAAESRYSDHCSGRTSHSPPAAAPPPPAAHLDGQLNHRDTVSVNSQHDEDLTQDLIPFHLEIFYINIWRGTFRPFWALLYVYFFSICRKTICLMIKKQFTHCQIFYSQPSNKQGERSLPWYHARCLNKEFLTEHKYKGEELLWMFKNKKTHKQKSTKLAKMF